MTGEEAGPVTCGGRRWKLGVHGTCAVVANKSVVPRLEISARVGQGTTPSARASSIARHRTVQYREYLGTWVSTTPSLCPEQPRI